MYFYIFFTKYLLFFKKKHSGQIVECESIKGVKGIGLVGGNKCFIYISKGPPLNQKTAKQICEGQGFTIAELTSQLESVAVSVQ